MKTLTIEKNTSPFPHLIVNNMYTEGELALIWQELDLLTYPSKLEEPGVYVGAAKSSTGDYLSNAKVLALDNVYQKREYSNILTVNRKLFTDGFLQIYSELSPELKHVPRVSNDFTKLRYYQNGEFFNPHTDMFDCYTALSYFYREPKQFLGGELFFPLHNYEFDCEHNSMILFQGYIEHGVKEVKINEKPFSGNSRYCMTQFLFHTRDFS